MSAKCPNKECNGNDLFFLQSLKKEKGKRYKILNYFCPQCGYVRMFNIEITKKQYKKEEERC